jgi:MFS family permease
VISGKLQLQRRTMILANAMDSGPKRLWVTGYIIIAASAIGSGFCQTRIQFDVLRGLAGIGVALSCKSCYFISANTNCTVPNAVAMLGRAYPPGRPRNIIFAAVGALGPIGFITGGTVGALFAVLVEPRWIWWFLYVSSPNPITIAEIRRAIFTTALLALGIPILPSDPPAGSVRSFDFIGFLLLAATLGLFNFSWNQAPITGWSESYVWAILLVSAAFGVAFYFWAKHMGAKAIIPIEVLQKRSLLVYLSLWLGWMSLGVFLFYTVNL